MPLRLEVFGRFEFDPTTSGIDPSEIWSRCLVPFLEDARADPDGFLADLRALAAADRGGFATFGAARLVWELYGDEALQRPAAWPLIDAGIEFKRARGLPGMSFTGYEHQRMDAHRPDPASAPSCPSVGVRTEAGRDGVDPDYSHNQDRGIR